MNFVYPLLMRSIQSKYIAQINELQSLQQQVSYWEKNTWDYKKALEVFNDYLRALKALGQPKELINAYIRMGSYCERMDDRLFSCSLYQEAINLLTQSGIGTSIHIKNLRNKIQSLYAD